MKKFLALLLSAVMVMGAAGCGSSEPAEPEIADTESTVTENEDGTRTIIDQVGNEVVLPEKVERVVIASVWPLASVYVLAMGTDKLVGLDPAIISAAENSQLINIAPEISDIPSGFSQNGSINAEELLKLDPDVVLYATGVMEDYEIATQAGIPAVGFSLSIKDFNAVETINSWIEQLEDVMGVEISSDEYVKYGSELEAQILDTVAQIPEEEKPRVMFIHRYSDNTVSVGGAKTWADYWITASGAVNVAAEVEGTNEVSIEQVYEWNPDKIFITNFNDALPEDIYNNKLCSADWSLINASANKEVYKVPLGMYRWYVTCSDSPMMLLWMAKTNQPEAFADIDFNQTIKDFYKQFYEYDLTDEQINEIINPVREAAGGI